MSEKEQKYGEREVRSFGSHAEPKKGDSGSRTIVGYAIVFNQRSQVLVDLGDRFEEVILPEAVTQELINRCDIKALIEHNRERLLARSNNGVGTLKLSVDSVGLRYEFEAPNTVDGDTALELVSRGDICGSSFAFRAVSDGAVERRWDAERKIWQYTVRKIDAIFDVTLTSDPAYTQTNVEARSIDAPKMNEKIVPLEDYYKRLGNL